MALDKSYLEYSHRSHGMDHDRYDWSMLTDRPKITWPDGKKLALWVNVPLQFFPLDQKGEPFKIQGGMTMPYPDLRHFSLRDYGNRVGIFRFLKAFDKYGVTPTFAMNTQLAKRNPYLLNTITERGNEVMCHGMHMDALHYGGQDKQLETQLVQDSVNQLRELTEQNITGWLSPGRNESENTPELLAANGIEYFCDWVNDDMPYRFKTDKGSLWAMPLSNELDDAFIMLNNLHSEDSYAEQMIDACDFLVKEANHSGGRILSLNIHPWMLGQPHRIGALEQVLEYVMSQDVYSASASDILQAFTSQTTT
ncbi:MAG: polysaccharide deacetylase [Alteromonadaceae bacterium]|uniref:polysaccharide deacetylase family protein n=1 Tax=Paraglaciecola chathamensis TaxID=368405 RepID=UPI000C65918B|nr:polysaccharide deacetylase family protein [Paraglaciecola agarilytica]MBN25008.1 polysaccharide deacetylase [Alteromonadaceae bacterium]|tara:strand:+ start:12900 stop:13826 length:927 start_codon:yes stop_codon:yes gene_type:complete